MPPELFLTSEGSELICHTHFEWLAIQARVENLQNAKQSQSPAGRAAARPWAMWEMCKFGPAEIAASDNVHRLALQWSLLSFLWMKWESAVISSCGLLSFHWQKIRTLLFANALPFAIQLRPSRVKLHLMFQWSRSPPMKEKVTSPIILPWPLPLPDPVMCSRRKTKQKQSSQQKNHFSLSLRSYIQNTKPGARGVIRLCGQGPDSGYDSYARSWTAHWRWPWHLSGIILKPIL